MVGTAITRVSSPAYFFKITEDDFRDYTRFNQWLRGIGDEFDRIFNVTTEENYKLGDLTTLWMCKDYKVGAGHIIIYQNELYTFMNEDTFRKTYHIITEDGTNRQED